MGAVQVSTDIYAADMIVIAQPFRNVRLAGMPIPPNYAFDGLLGLDLLSRGQLHVDGPGGTFTLSSDC